MDVCNIRVDIACLELNKNCDEQVVHVVKQGGDMQLRTHSHHSEHNIPPRILYFSKSQLQQYLQKRRRMNTVVPRTPTPWHSTWNCIKIDRQLASSTPNDEFDVFWITTHVNLTGEITYSDWTRHWDFGHFEGQSFLLEGNSGGKHTTIDFLGAGLDFGTCHACANRENIILRVRRRCFPFLSLAWFYLKLADK